MSQKPTDLPDARLLAIGERLVDSVWPQVLDAADAYAAEENRDQTAARVALSDIVGRVFLRRTGETYWKSNEREGKVHRRKEIGLLLGLTHQGVHRRYWRESDPG